MSVPYEQRLKTVADSLEDWFADTALTRSGVEKIAGEVLYALDHIPEKLDWVCEGQPRDQVTKR